MMMWPKAGAEVPCWAGRGGGRWALRRKQVHLPTGSPAPETAGRAAGQLPDAPVPGPRGPDGDRGRHPAPPGRAGRRHHQPEARATPEATLRGRERPRAPAQPQPTNQSRRCCCPAPGLWVKLLPGQSPRWEDSARAAGMRGKPCTPHLGRRQFVFREAPGQPRGRWEGGGGPGAL